MLPTGLASTAAPDPAAAVAGAAVTGAADGGAADAGADVAEPLLQPVRATATTSAAPPKRILGDATFAPRHRWVASVRRRTDHRSDYVPPGPAGFGSMTLDASPTAWRACSGPPAPTGTRASLTGHSRMVRISAGGVSGSLR